MAHTICGIDVGAYSVKFAFLEVGFRTNHAARAAGDRGARRRRAAAAAADGRRARGLWRRSRARSTPYLGAAAAISSRSACWSCRSRIRARSIRSSATSWRAQIVHAIEDVVFDHLVVGQRPEGSTVLAAAAKRDDLAAHRGRRGGSAASTRARCSRRRSIYRTLLPFAGATSSRRASHPVPGGARLRPPAHQHLLRPRRRADLRADDPARRRAPDRRDREGVQRRRRARRAGQARRRVPRQPGAARRPRRSASSWTPCCARRWRRRSASCARRWPASARPTDSTSTRCWWWAAAGGSAGLLPFLEAELGIPARFPSIRPGAGVGRRGVRATVAGEEGAAPESDTYALAPAIAIAAQPRLARDRLPPRAVRLPRQLLDPAPEGAAHRRAGGGAAAGGRPRRRRPVLAT